MKVGGSQSKDVDQILTSMINDASGAKLGYIPFKSGGEAAVQLAGDHIAANVNNPNENLGQWQGGVIRPLCVFSPERMAKGEPVHDGMGWADIPTCSEAGLPIASYQMPRTVWTPAGLPEEALAFYTDLMKKVSETPEWQEYVAKTSQTGRFLAGAELEDFIAGSQDNALKVFKAEGWLVQ